MTAAGQSLRRRYESLFFIGLGVVVVLLPFPNIFGILLDGAILAIATPFIGNRATLVLIFIYNFNPLKLNGVIGLYYVIYAILVVVLGIYVPSATALQISILDLGILLSLSALEYLIIKDASVALWKRLAVRHPAFLGYASR